MTKALIDMTDREIIEHYGGDTKLALLLGFDRFNGQRRVANWKRRNNIPAAIKIKFPRVFLRGTIRRSRQAKKADDNG